MSEPRDSVVHQLIRAFSGIGLIMLPLGATVAAYAVWAMRQPSLVGERSTIVALAIGLAVMVPCFWLQLRILKRFAPPEPPPLLSPDLPRCERCGYDLRASPDRCPECGTPIAK